MKYFSHLITSSVAGCWPCAMGGRRVSWVVVVVV
jgi:hypothetical protein